MKSAQGRSFRNRFEYRFEVALDERPILPRRALAVLQHILCGTYGFVIDPPVIQLRALLPAGLFNVGPANAAGAAHAFLNLLLKTDRESGGCAFIGAPLALLFRDAKALATSRLLGKITRLGDPGAADMPILLGVAFIALGKLLQSGLLLVDLFLEAFKLLSGLFERFPGTGHILVRDRTSCCSQLIRQRLEFRPRNP